MGVLPCSIVLLPTFVLLPRTAYVTVFTTLRYILHPLFAGAYPLRLRLIYVHCSAGVCCLLHGERLLCGRADWVVRVIILLGCLTLCRLRDIVI